jgi:hypothetical protein
MRRVVGVTLVVTLAACGLTGCGGDAPPPAGSFAPLHYEYLNKLRLNVGSIDIENNAAPIGPDDISAQSPVTPAQALVQIGHDRLFAAGLMGSAHFVIDQASIVRGAGGGLYGQMAVHLEVLTAGGARAGYAEARVARTHMPGSDEENLQTVLYDMTRQMADAMNVELEYQMRRSMGDFLVSAAVVPSTVTAVPLTPGAPPPAAPYGAPGYGEPGHGEPGHGEPGHGQPGYGQPGYAPPGYAPPGYGQPGTVPAVPGDQPPGEPAEGAPPPPPPQQMSPPPGYLQLPPGAGQP